MMYGIYIDPKSKLPVTRQICQQLRELIESGLLPAGIRLLPSRSLAKEWGIARNVVIEVYEQLTAEGYLEGRVGSGTYVAEGINLSPRPQMHGVSSEAGRTLQDVDHQDIINFATGVPDLKQFPRKIWGKYLKDAAETAPGEGDDYGDIYGDEGLRSAICDFLFRAKGIQCSVEHIMIVSGASEGFFLLAKSLSSNFHSLYIEDPTIDFTRDIFQMMNYNLVPVEVDSNGMNVDSLTRFETGHIALLTPSHQFPTGSLLSIQRRHKAIRFAEEANSYIIEDDYDSEFRLRGIPVPPLQTLSPSRVIYVGTFSKTLLPNLRIGFLIVPPNLSGRIAITKEKLNMHTPIIIQHALRQFILDGQLERHIHTMKKMYKKRRNLLTDRLIKAFGQEISILGDNAGMHLQVHFNRIHPCELSWSDTLSFGFRVETTNDYNLTDRKNHESIVLGYGNLSTDEIVEGVNRIHKFVSSNGNSPAL
ncbi:PLP-dependent aminotransferase family protein [Paenibacillus dokdonensis]|uniref:PLP-dependent aminotransferase family protein n=2 Tax=Paenibacillus dokdonensis TaxID=2567944 RepID=A0ABU6GJY8_9BACL|nr:PLP-dependent aminotransferase family protein [Paenibacillus dokdonensis]MEC0240049.1 PLP-dependent aminotransferase family protein [Paenibacillus dokdonensis]